jgi:hypothetical protein
MSVGRRGDRCVCVPPRARPAGCGSGTPPARATAAARPATAAPLSHCRCGRRRRAAACGPCHVCRHLAEPARARARRTSGRWKLPMPIIDPSWSRPTDKNAPPNRHKNPAAPAAEGCWRRRWPQQRFLQRLRRRERDVAAPRPRRQDQIGDTTQHVHRAHAALCFLCLHRPCVLPLDRLISAPQLVAVFLVEQDLDFAVGAEEALEDRGHAGDHIAGIERVDHPGPSPPTPHRAG